MQSYDNDDIIECERQFPIAIQSIIHHFPELQAICDMIVVSAIPSLVLVIAASLCIREFPYQFLV